MKRLFVLSLIFMSGILLASCESEAPAAVKPTVNKPVTAVIKPSPSPVIQETVSPEVSAISKEFDNINPDKDFPTFTDKDLQN